MRRLLIVEDTEIVASGLRATLLEDADNEVVAIECGTVNRWNSHGIDEAGDGGRHTMKRSLISLVVAVLISLSSAQPALALTAPVPSSGGTWNPDQWVGYSWKDGAEPPTWMRGAINDAGADSTASRDAKAARLYYSSTAASWIAYTDWADNCCIGFVPDKDPPNWFHMKLRPQGTQLNFGKLKWCQYYGSTSNWPDGCFNVETIALHEFGHVQGLGHIEDAATQPPNWTDTIMHKVMRDKPQNGWNLQEFRRCDVARLQMRYEALAASTPISSCIEVDTTLLLGASRTTVPAGTTVTFTATLKVAGYEYAYLAGDELDGRNVDLQRRPIGGSTWTDYANMSPINDGTGRYQVTLSISNSYEWRAQFSTPASEGLIGSNSSAVIVAVECSSGTLVPCA